VNLYDLANHDMLDMIVSATRTVHCLDYTVGWRKARGAIFLGINITPPAPRDGERERVGTPAQGDGVPVPGEYY
jgi:hypothetical protein